VESEIRQAIEIQDATTRVVWRKQDAGNILKWMIANPEEGLVLCREFFATVPLTIVVGPPAPEPAAAPDRRSIAEAVLAHRAFMATRDMMMRTRDSAYYDGCEREIRKIDAEARLQRVSVGPDGSVGVAPEDQAIASPQPVVLSDGSSIAWFAAHLPDLLTIVGADGSSIAWFENHSRPRHVPDEPPAVEPEATAVATLDSSRSNVFASAIDSRGSVTVRGTIVEGDPEPAVDEPEETEHDRMMRFFKGS
jgi:hypothetical protein